MSVKAKHYSEASVQRAYNTGFTRSGRMFKKELVRGLATGSRSGRTYLLRGKRYTASAPGEMPAKRSGALADSVNFSVNHLSVTFGDTEFYGEYLEDGTAKMEPRPHVRIIGQSHGSDGMRIVAEALGRAFV